MKSIQVFRQLLETYLRHLYDHGVKQIHAQMVTFDGRRGSKLFERYGFKVINQSEITKYRRYTDQTVYLCTIVKTLERENERLLYPKSRVRTKGRSSEPSAVRRREQSYWVNMTHLLLSILTLK